LPNTKIKAVGGQRKKLKFTLSVDGRVLAAPGGIRGRLLVPAHNGT